MVSAPLNWEVATENAGMFIIFTNLDLGTFIVANDSLIKNVILLHGDTMQTKRLVKPSVTKIQS